MASLGSGRTPKDLVNNFKVRFNNNNSTCSKFELEQSLNDILPISRDSLNATLHQLRLSLKNTAKNQKKPYEYKVNKHYQNETNTQ